MCNTGKFIERSPNIRPAGIPVLCNEPAGDSLKYHPEAELVESWVKAQCPKKTSGPQFPSAPFLPNVTLQEILTPELQKSRFTKFREAFYEDMYLRKPELGKAKATHSIPDNITNENTLFGKKLESTGTLYDVVFPNKSVSEVNHDYVKWHDKYLISHKHYFPAERIHRNYNGHFNPQKTFGIVQNPDLLGGKTKRCLQHSHKLVFVRDLQKYYLNRTFGEHGKKLSKFNDTRFQNYNTTYGRPPNANKCTSQDIVHNVDPCETDKELLNTIAYLNNARHLLQKDPRFIPTELELELKKADVEKTGYLSLSDAFEATRCLHIYLNDRKMRDALIFYGLILDVGSSNERIGIYDYAKALQFKYPLPRAGAIALRPKSTLDLDTTYRLFCRDRINQVHEQETTEPMQQHRKYVPCSVKDLMVPDTAMKLGLLPWDFEQPRNKEQLQRIFTKVMSSEEFEQLWESVKEKTKPINDLISVNAIQAELKAIRLADEGVA